MATHSRENPKDRGAWRAPVQGVAESGTTEHAGKRAHAVKHSSQLTPGGWSPGGWAPPWSGKLDPTPRSRRHPSKPASLVLGTDKTGVGEAAFSRCEASAVTMPQRRAETRSAQGKKHCLPQRLPNKWKRRNFRITKSPFCDLSAHQRKTTQRSSPDEAQLPPRKSSGQTKPERTQTPASATTNL